MTITTHQRAAIARYVAGGHVAINGDCRGDGAGDPQVFTDIAQLDAAIAATALGSEATVYRGVSKRYADELERRGLSAGDVLVDKAFLSTSRDRTVARRFLGWERGGLLLRIRLPQGVRALDLAPYSDAADEQEILLPRDTRMRILSYDAVEDVLDMEVIDDG